VLQEKNSPIYLSLLLLIAVIFVGGLFGPNLGAKFGLLDDHEIVEYVRQAHGSFRQFFELVGSSEVGNFGHAVHFRPGYYTIYVTESLVWGANPFLWYLFRFLMCVTFVFACLKIIDRYFGLACALLFVALMFSYAYWTDVWSRLGPGESYCAFGWALFSLGFIELIDKNPPKREWPYNLLILFGVLIGAGGKENFLLLMLPLLALVWIRYRRNTLSVGLALVSILSAVYMMVIVIELLLAFSKVKVDVHGEALDMGSRLRLLGRLVRIPAFYNSLAAFIIGSIIWLVNRNSSRFGPLRRSVVVLTIIGLCGMFLSLTQIVFYNGNWPAKIRFDFPGMMITPLIVVASATLATGVIRSFWSKTPTYFIPLLIAIVSGYTIIQGFQEVRAGSVRNEQLTTDISSKIDLIAKTLKADPNAVLVLENYDAFNYEYLVGIQQFLHFYKVENPIVVRNHGYNVEDQTSDLLKTIVRIEFGWEEAGKSQLAAASKCYSVHFSGHQPTNCQDLADLFR